MPVLRLFLRIKPADRLRIAQFIADGKIVVSPETDRSIPAKVWADPLHRYFRGDWPTLTSEDLLRLPAYSREGLYLMTGYGEGLERIHVLMDGDQRATRVRLAWE